MSWYAAVDLDASFWTSSRSEAERSAQALLGDCAQWQTEKGLDPLVAHHQPQGVCVIRQVAEAKLVKKTLREVLCPNGQNHLFLGSYTEEQLNEPRYRYEIVKVK